MFHIICKNKIVYRCVANYAGVAVKLFNNFVVHWKSSLFIAITHCLIFLYSYLFRCAKEAYEFWLIFLCKNRISECFMIWIEKLASILIRSVWKNYIKGVSCYMHDWNCLAIRHWTFCVFQEMSNIKIIIIIRVSSSFWLFNLRDLLMVCFSFIHIYRNYEYQKCPTRRIFFIIIIECRSDVASKPATFTSAKECRIQ